MGIKFLCTHCGHKLNVKSFLAGKRGICPKCQAKVDIPGQRQDKAPHSEPGNAQRAALEALGLDPGPAPLARPAAAAPLGGMPAGGGYAGPVAMPRTTPGAALPAAAALPAKPVGLQPYAAATVATPAALPATPAMPVAPAYGAPAGALPHMAAVPVATAPLPAAPLAPVTPPAPPSDPITEAPNAVWYVRPPSGGQFGPAAGDTMRKWLAEGRVTAESLIWREGWADWKKANLAFPSLGGVTPAEPAIAAGAARPATSATAPRTPPAGNQMAIIIVVLLVVLTIILLGVLVYVLNQMPKGSPDDPKSTAWAPAAVYAQRE